MREHVIPHGRGDLIEYGDLIPRLDKEKSEGCECDEVILGRYAYGEGSLVTCASAVI